MPARYVPERGDIVWLTFDPQAGHEQAGRRPALVLSPKAYNARAGLALDLPDYEPAEGLPFRGRPTEATCILCCARRPGARVWIGPHGVRKGPGGRLTKR